MVIFLLELHYISQQCFISDTKYIFLSQTGQTPLSVVFTRKVTIFQPNGLNKKVFKESCGHYRTDAITSGNGTVYVRPRLLSIQISTPDKVISFTLDISMTLTLEKNHS